MEFWRTILVLLRRKSVALPVLLFSLGVAAVTYLAIPTQYMSAATTVLTASANAGIVAQDPTHQPAVNPLLNFDGMKTEAAILIQVLSTRDVADQLGAIKGGSTTFTVSDGSVIPQLLGSSGPFIVIDGYSTSPAAARDMVVRVEQRLRDELINQQRALKTPASTFIGMIDVVPPSVPEAQVATKLEAAVGALVIGLIASTSIAYLAHRTRTTAVTRSSAVDTVLPRHDEAPTIQAS